MTEYEKNRERRKMEKALHAVESCDGNCKNCKHLHFIFAETKHAIIYNIECAAAGKYGAISDCIETLRAETLEEITNSMREFEIFNN